MISFAAADLDAWLSALLYPFFRMLALMSAAPVFSHESVPIPVRIGLALLLTILVAPVLPAVGVVSPLSAPGLLLICQQLLVGVALGFAMQIAFAAVELAGDMIGLQMGLSFAVFIDPQNSDQTPIVGSFLSMILMLVFVTINGHLMLVSALVDTFKTVPIAVGVSVGGAHGETWLRLAGAGTQLFASGLQIAFPVIAALMLANLALGVLTRTAPQLNLFAVGFPITVMLGLLMLLLGMPHLMPVLEGTLSMGLKLFTG
jgi:flagellar biosynthetic protein FliR